MRVGFIRSTNFDSFTMGKKMLEVFFTIITISADILHYQILETRVVCVLSSGTTGL